MGKIAVVYDSLSGNTQKMAELVGEGARRVEGMEVRVVSISEADAAEVARMADGIALGSPCNLGVMSWRMKRFWDEQMEPYWMSLDGKIGCAFSSAGAWGGGAEITCQALNTVLMNFGFLTSASPTMSAKPPAPTTAPLLCGKQGTRRSKNPAANWVNGWPNGWEHTSTGAPTCTPWCANRAANGPGLETHTAGRASRPARNQPP